MYLHAPTKSVFLDVPDPFLIRSLLPKSKVIDHANYNVMVHHTMVTTKVLRNLGLDVPPPIENWYSWPGKYKPFEHQRTMAGFLTMHRRAFNLSDMGVGKSAAALWAADYLMRVGRVKKCLILSPLSTLERVWKNDIFDVLMHRTAVVVHGSRQRRMDRLAIDADFYILNHDGVNIPDVHKAILTDPDFNLIIVDEGSMFRNHGTKKYKALEKLLRPDMRLWWITGTPCPNAPTDAWAQAKLVAPDRVPKFFGAFRRATMMQISQFKWAPRVDGYNHAFEAMQPATRFKKADCLDLPPVVFTERSCGLTQEQQDAFDTMRKSMQAEAKDTVITAANAADKINKLRQILCGAIKDPNTDTYLTYPHGPRFDVLKECIEEANAKVLVVTPFKGIVRALTPQLEKFWSVGVLNGDVSPKRRDQIIAEFKHTPDPHILLCHPKVMSHGLNLTEADTLIFYAPIYSNDEFQQVMERFNRAGQTRKMTIVKMAAHSLEWRIYNMLNAKKLTQDSILNLYNSVVE